MRLRVILLCCLIAGLVLNLSELHWPSRLKPQVKWSRPLRDTLAAAAARSLASGDVPVGAILSYNDSIIGTGWNTVRAAGDAAGHAEVNAISDAIRRTGPDRFKSLDRERLKLFATYQPCDMCAAIIREYGIRRVEYGFPKSNGHWFRNWLKRWRYAVYERQGDGVALQDSLFRLHPGYKGDYSD